MECGSGRVGSSGDNCGVLQVLGSGAVVVLVGSDVGSQLSTVLSGEPPKEAFPFI